MFNKKKAVLLVNCFSNGIDVFGNLYNELQYYKGFDVYNFYLFKKEKIIDSITNLIDILITKKYKQIYLIGHNIGSNIILYLTSKYREITKIIISNPIITTKELNTCLFKNTKKEITKLNYECIKNLTTITCPILIIHGLNNNISKLEVSIYIHSNVSSNINYLVTLKDVGNDIYTGNRYKEIYKLIIDFLILKHESNTIHLNI